MSEYERWLLDGDINVAVELLHRLAAQVTRTRSFRPPAGYSWWSDDAIDELLAEMVDKKNGVAFLIETLIAADDQGSAERYLLTTIENFLKDQAKATPHGKLRNRLDTILGQDQRFEAESVPVRGWRLAGETTEWWQGDVTDLERVAFAVRGVCIRSWNTSGPTPAAARTPLTTVAVAVLAAAGGTVRAEDLARVLLARFRFAIAPETAEEFLTGDSAERHSLDGSGPESALTSITADELWMVLTPDQRAIVPYLTEPTAAVEALGIGRKEAKARIAQVMDIVRLATVDDPHAEQVVTALLHRGSLAVGVPVDELGRPTSGEAGSTSGRRDR